MRRQRPTVRANPGPDTSYASQLPLAPDHVAFDRTHARQHTLSTRTVNDVCTHAASEVGPAQGQPVLDD